jgi:hypothetical protein
MSASARDAWSRPVAYGTPAQVAVFLESVARVLEAEPQRVFTDPEVRCSAERLTGVLGDRIVKDVDRPNGRQQPS